MPRPYVEFIHSQTLTWAGKSPLIRREHHAWKLLSRDAANGEVSGLLRFLEAWRAEFSSEFQEEIYVLDGRLRLGDEHLERDGYARIGARRTTYWEADPGTVILVFSNSGTAADDGAELTIKDTVAMPWDRSGVPPELDYMGIARKALFVDAGTQNHRTWLLTTAPQCVPHGEQLRRETHGCAEELFMLCGEITGPQGVMYPGAYFWRPRETLHGPFGSREGSLALCRFRHGKQTTQFHNATLPFSFDAPYRPILPAELLDVPPYTQYPVAPY